MLWLDEQAACASVAAQGQLPRTEVAVLLPLLHYLHCSELPQQR